MKLKQLAHQQRPNHASKEKAEGMFYLFFPDEEQMRGMKGLNV